MRIIIIIIMKLPNLQWACGIGLGALRRREFQYLGGPRVGIESLFGDLRLEFGVKPIETVTILGKRQLGESEFAVRASCKTLWFWFWGEGV